MTQLKRVSRIAASPLLVLDGSENYYHNLTTIKTSSKNKREMKEKIRTDLKNWLNNPTLYSMQNQSLDIAIVVRVNSIKVDRQDVDNVAKVVLDALKKKEGDSRFLFHDDNQVIRLLVYKLKSEDVTGHITDSLTVSFRVHDPDKQMLLIDPSVLVKIK